MFISINCIFCHPTLKKYFQCIVSEERFLLHKTLLHNKTFRVPGVGSGVLSRRRPAHAGGAALPPRAAPASRSVLYTNTLHSVHTIIPDTSHGHMFRYGRFMHCAFHIISLNFLFLLLIDIIKIK